MATVYIKAAVNFLKSLPSLEADVEKQQVDLIREKIRVSSADEAAEMICALKELPISEINLKELISKVTQETMKVQSNQSLVGRRSLQDFTTFWKYMTDVKFQHLQQSTDKLSWLVREAGKLGLCNPSEKTYQVLTAVLLLSGKTLDISPAIKFESLKAVKAAFTRVVKTGTAETWLPTLPEPEALLQTHSSLASSFFGSAGMSIASIDAVGFSNLVESIPMRTSRKDSKVQQISFENKTESSAVVQLTQQLQQMQYMQAMTLHAIGHPVNSMQPASMGSQFMLAPTLQGSLPSLSAARPALAIEDTPSLPAVVTPSIDAKDNDPPEQQQQQPQSKKGRLSLEDVTKTLQASMEKEKPLKKKAASKTKAMKKVANKKVAEKKTECKKATSPKQAPGSKAAGKALKAPKETLKLSLAERLKLRPSGCSKCRRKPGCTPSCLKNYKK